MKDEPVEELISTERL